MIRTINAAERSISVQAPNVITIAADSDSTNATDGSGIPIADGNTYKGTCIFQDLNRTSREEIAYRYVQNVGDNRLYFSIGSLGCDNINNFHGYLEVGQQLDCSNHRLSVWGYSVAGTTVATQLYQRNDLTNAPTMGSGNFI